MRLPDCTIDRHANARSGRSLDMGKRELLESDTQRVVPPIFFESEHMTRLSTRMLLGVLAACCIASAQDEQKMPFKKRDLIRQLQQGNEEKRAEAALLLRHDPKAVPFLLKALREDVSDEVRLWAAYALGELRARSVVDDLLELLEIRPERPGADIVRRNICWALGNMGDRRAIKPLMKEVERAKYWGIRREAAFALAKLGAVQALPLLDKVAKSDPYKSPERYFFPVRTQAKRAADIIREFIKQRKKHRRGPSPG